MFNSIYKGKKVLITGITGFKGSWLALWLIKLGAEVVGIADKIPTQPSLYEILGLGEKITYFKEDVRNLEPLKEIVKNTAPDFVFHLAAQPIVSLSYLDPVNTLSTNIIGTVNLLEALRISGKPCSAILITSDKCYENLEWTWGYRENDRLVGRDPYSASKSAAELVINSYYNSFFSSEDSKIRVMSTRAGNVIGGGDWAQDRFIPDCIRAWSENKEVEIRNPDTTRPWQHVLEPLSGYLRCGQVLCNDETYNGEAFNFGPSSDQNFSVLELLNAISEHWQFAEGAKRYFVKKQDSYHEAGLLKLNCDKALHKLNWRPILSVDVTAKLTASWYNAFYNLKNFNSFEFTSEQIDFYCNSAEKEKLPWAIQ